MRFSSIMSANNTPHYSTGLRKRSSIIGIPIALLLFALTSCAAKPAGLESPPPPVQVVITAQPTNQFVPMGRPATFTVTATGTAPLRYQWSRNGVDVSGATSASYSTPNVMLADTGAIFKVTVSNAANSVTSSAATLTAGPRAPAVGDLRYLLYQQVTVPGFGRIDPAGGGVVGGMWMSYKDALGSPLMLGSEDNCAPISLSRCDYLFFVYSLPPPMTGLSTSYQAAGYGGSYSNVDAGLRSSIVAPNVVIFSLDLESPFHALGLAWVKTDQTGGFDYRMEAVTPDQIAATVAADGAQSRIITAATFDDASGKAILISYGWQGDTTTAYESKTTVVAKEMVAAASAELANGGYFISAFGGNDIDGYIIVGMRVAGDTMPRPASIGTLGGQIPPVNPDSAYYTTVVYLGYAGNYALIQEQ